MEKRKKIQYGFIVIVACMLLQAVVFGVASNIHPQFLGYIVEDGGFALSAISGMFTVGTIVSAIFSPAIGKMFNKIPFKFMYLGGSIVSALGVLILGFANNVGMFYIGYSIAQTGVSAISSIGLPILISSWFDESTKGKALGIAFAGGSIGNIFLQQIAVKWLNEIGYSEAYVRFAIVSLIVGTVISLFLIRGPKDSSEVVSGKNKENTENKENTKTEEKWGYTFAEIKSMKSYWLYATGFLFIGMYVSVLATQYSAYLKSLDFNPVTLGAVGSTFALFSLFGNLVGGMLYDKIGVHKTTIVGFILATVACLGLIFAPKIPALAYLYGASKGLSVFAYMLAPSMLAGALFGQKDFGTIFATTNLFFAVGFAGGSTGFGILVDTVGYGTSWLVVLGSIVAGYALLLYGIKTFTKLNKERFNR